MQLPKKISPDSIKDSIIEFRYTSKLPFEVIIGIFFQLLDESYTYTNRPINAIQSLTKLSAGDRLLIENNSIIFHNQNIKINLRPNSFVFNCTHKYLGWHNYKAEIASIILQLPKTKIVEKYVRVGLRYITEYANTDLQQCVDFKFSFGMEHIKSDTYNFHSEFKIAPYRAILNLSSKVPVARTNPVGSMPQITPVSQVDIDVIAEKFEETDTVRLLNILDEVHEKEKEIFFNLLNKEFLRTLQPEY